MGFNFGAFAGGLAQGGMQTYQMLEAIESQKKRDALVELQAQEAKQNMEERAKLREAGEVYGKVGGQDYTGALQTATGMGQQQAQGLSVNTGVGGDDFDRAVNQSTAAVALENKARAQAKAQGIPTDDTVIAQQAQAGAAAMKPTTYTREQADADYLRRVAAINPEKALDIEGKQMTIATGRSSLKRIQAEDEFAAWHQKSMEQAYADPVGFLKANLGAYNSARKGSHLDDGKTAEIVPSADGKTYSFVQKDTKGKVVGSTPINQDTALAALKHLAFDKYSALPGKFMEARKEATAERGVAVHEKELAEKINAGLFGAQAKQALGAANASNAHAAVYGNMLTLAKENKAAGDAMKPFIEQFSALTPEEQQGSKGISVLTAGAAAAAKKTGDITGIISALKKPDADTKITVNPDGSVTQGGNLYVPDPNKPGAYKPATGIGPSSLDKAIAAKLKADTEKTKPAVQTEEKPSALPPKKTTTSDFSVSGGRGIYTVKGLPSTFKSKADAEKAAQEAQKKRSEAEVTSALERD